MSLDRLSARARRGLRRALPARVRRRMRALIGHASPTEHQWQHRRIEGTEERWAMIAATLTEADRSLLDLGCNAGLLTASAADAGLVALGIDLNADAIHAARDAFGDREHLAFMVHGIDAAGISALPRFDVVLFLSVYHQWVGRYGNEVAESMLGDMIGRARHRLLFETAGVARKYGDHVPGELADDRSAVVEYVAALLTRVAPPGATIRHLGQTTTPDEDEVVRHLFSIDVGAAGPPPHGP